MFLFFFLVQFFVAPARPCRLAACLIPWGGRCWAASVDNCSRFVVAASASAILKFFFISFVFILLNKPCNSFESPVRYRPCSPAGQCLVLNRCPPSPFTLLDFLTSGCRGRGGGPLPGQRRKCKRVFCSFFFCSCFCFDFLFVGLCGKKFYCGFRFLHKARARFECPLSHALHHCCCYCFLLTFCLADPLSS